MLQGTTPVVSAVMTVMDSRVTYGVVQRDVERQTNGYLVNLLKQATHGEIPTDPRFLPGTKALNRLQGGGDGRSDLELQDTSAALPCAFMW